MGFSAEYWYSFHYSDGRGYLIFCCHGVANEVLPTPVPAMSGGHGVRLILSEDKGHARKNPFDGFPR